MSKEPRPHPQGIRAARNMIPGRTIQKQAVQEQATKARTAQDKAGTDADPCLNPGETAVPEGWEEGEPLPESLAHNPQPLLDCVVQIAGQRPQAIAVIAAGRTLDYGALVTATDALAQRLRAAGLQAGEPVGLCMEAAPELVVGFLGILAAGGVVMPLDPLLPPARLAGMATAAGAGRVLAHCATLGLWSGETRLAIWDLDAPDAPGAPDAPDALKDLEKLENLAAPTVPPRIEEAAAAASPLACLYHTSGSTGRPKPVAIAHATLSRRILSMAAWFGLGCDEVVCGASSLAFDPFLQQLFFPLCSGGVLWLPGRERLLDAAAFWREAEQVGVTHLNMVPSQVEGLLELAPAAGLARLRRVVMGGERMAPALPSRIRQRLGAGVAVYNMYGPTEGTVDATGFCIPPGPIPEAIPIGQPLPGCRIRILDPELRRVAVGEAGELCIGGAGLAEGYAGMDEETRQRFVADPFGPPGSRLYRTGDLARWQDDGRVAFIGRQDEQIKIRGQRIELGEIEAALRDQPGVTAAAARLWPQAPGGARVVAFVTGGADPAALTTALAARLPAAAVPLLIGVLEALPRLPSGKIDRQALPDPQTLVPVAASAPGPDSGARAAMEQKVAAIWRDLLDGVAVDPHANLFECGVHSLLIIRAQAPLSALAGREISAATLFRYPTVASLAAHLTGETVLPPPPAARVPETLAETVAGLEQAVAVVGLAFRFPGAADQETFWHNLLAGITSIRRFDPAALATAGADPALIGHPDFIPVNAELEGLDQFDPLPFAYTPADAAEMDPQQRLLLETAWRALEDAACDPARDGPVGVYAGVGFNAYLLDNLQARSGFAGGPGRYFLVVNNDKDFAATRLAYKLGLTGPAMTISTACSTGLATVAQAVDGLRAGRCRVALAGSASAGMFSPWGYIHTDGGIASRAGTCRPFDAAADGTVGGAGAGVVVLKRLSDALADGDTIHALIRGVGIANDGAARAAFSAPSVDGQAAALRAALADARLPPAAIGHVEAHGTATPLGDPIEVAALNLVYGAAPPGSVLLGSVKGNIGHLDAAAGIAGLIKTILALRQGIIPPLARFDHPNPQIPFAEGPFRPAIQAEPWPTPADQPRRAAVSSFGMGGTNLHLILEQAPPPAPHRPSPPDATPTPVPRLLALSAATPSARETLARSIAAALRPAAGADSNSDPDSDPDSRVAADTDSALARFAATAHSLRTGRRRLRWRQAVVARGPAAAIPLLETGGGTLGEREPGAPSLRPAWLFPGQGSQQPGMGRDLYRTYPLFRAVVDEAEDRLAGTAAAGLRDLLLADPADGAAAARLADTAVTQPALLVMEYGMARLLEHFGLHPEALAGHSVGEYVAATLAGVMTFPQALDLVAARGRLMAQAPRGAMLAISAMSEEAVRALLTETASPAEIATLNGSRQCVVAGDDAAIAALEAVLKAQNRLAQRLRVSHAFHCALMDPILDAFAAEVARTPLRPARIPLLSNLSGDWAAPETFADPAYWVRHLRGTVRFADTLRRLLETPGRVLVEVGPGTTLSRFARTAGALENQVFTTLPGAGGRTGGGKADSEQDGAVALVQMIGALWCRGLEPDWTALEADASPGRIPLPTYPFERKRYWIEPPPRSAGKERIPALEPAGERTCAASGPPGSSATPVACAKPPEEAVMAVVIQAWQELLGESAIGPESDFLALGGDSLAAVRVSAFLREQLNRDVPASLLFKARTVRGLAAALAASEPAGASEPAARVPMDIPPDVPSLPEIPSFPASSDIPATAREEGWL